MRAHAVVLVALAGLVAGTICFPARIDDNGADVVAVNLQTTVATELPDPAMGCDSGGAAANSNCMDWGSQALSASAGDTTLSDDLGFQRSAIDCSASGHLYCLEEP